MAKLRSTGPRCPNCGKMPYDIVKWEKPDKGPPLRVLRWFCPDVGCNPEARTMADKEVWDQGTS